MLILGAVVGPAVVQIFHRTVQHSTLARLVFLLLRLGVAHLPPDVALSFLARVRWLRLGRFLGCQMVFGRLPPDDLLFRFIEVGLLLHILNELVSNRSGFGR